MKTPRRYFTLVTTCLPLLIAVLLIGMSLSDSTVRGSYSTEYTNAPKSTPAPCFPDTCDPNNDGCIGPLYPCTTEADCSADGWYCCGPKSDPANPLAESFYREYFCTITDTCDYTIMASYDCDQDDDDFCEGDIAKHKGCTCMSEDLVVTCICITTSENCDDDDGCYVYGNGCEDRDYYCSAGSCEYPSNGYTDYYEDWVYYCDGDNRRAHRRFHNYYCDEGLCQDHPIWVDDQLVENCNDDDGWYGACQNAEEYRDYCCTEHNSTADCDEYIVTDHRCKADYGDCDNNWATCCEANLNSDKYNCGSCGNVCGGTTPGCCSGNCKDLNSDKYNCGSCDHNCVRDYDGNENNQCIDGVCCDPNAVGLYSFTATDGEVPSVSQSATWLWQSARVIIGLAALVGAGIVWRRRRHR